ncbi:Protein C10 [Galemys pyrenaicus]|uniref:Protein C10 n=1 Tax=Galemys pyrenaicus TaxID=202257 RepID=A0A8J5ZTL7_GALPY|nr:Protein C10 [Galemys pyrenaicus]
MRQAARLQQVAPAGLRSPGANRQAEEVRAEVIQACWALENGVGMDEDGDMGKMPPSVPPETMHIQARGFSCDGVLKFARLVRCYPCCRGENSRRWT